MLLRPDLRCSLHHAAFALVDNSLMGYMVVTLSNWSHGELYQDHAKTAVNFISKCFYRTL